MRTPVLEVGRRDFGVTRLIDHDLGELADGAVRLRVERYAVTANTITYAAVGDMLDYWGFHPSGDPDWGRVPAMGWAEVVASNHPDVEVGTRVYGWVPMAKHFDLTVSVGATGLRDDGPHRVEHAPVYRTFEDTTKDPLHPGVIDPARTAEELTDLEDRHALLRGLFATGFLADQFFAVNDYFGATHVAVLSASSKTAIGYAACASRRDLNLVGITSPGNVDAVTALGLYDSVSTYDDAPGAIGTDVTAAIVDMAGNGAALAALHDSLGDRIAYSMAIGRSHHDAPPAAPSKGPQPQLFFAPMALSALSEGGVDTAETQKRMGAEMDDFIVGSHDWLTVERSSGPAAAEQTWHDVYNGDVPPSIGRITSLND